MPSNFQNIYKTEADQQRELGANTKRQSLPENSLEVRYLRCPGSWRGKVKSNSKDVQIINVISSYLN